MFESFYDISTGLSQVAIYSTTPPLRFLTREVGMFIVVLVTGGQEEFWGYYMTTIQWFKQEIVQGQVHSKCAFDRECCEDEGLHSDSSCGGEDQEFPGAVSSGVVGRTG